MANLDYDIILRKSSASVKRSDKNSSKDVKFSRKSFSKQVNTWNDFREKTVGTAGFLLSKISYKILAEILEIMGNNPYNEEDNKGTEKISRRLSYEGGNLKWRSSINW